MIRAIVVVAAAFLLACNDRSREVSPVTFEPPVDMGSDVRDLGTPVNPDEYCEGELDGASCELPGARGVCVEQRCVLVACESGFGDCTRAVGCETLLSQPGSCGSCGVVCAEGQGCLVGPGGYACAAGLVCPIDRFELDNDTTNGCEWSGAWESPFTLAPVDLEIEAMAWDEEFVVAGGVANERVSVTLGVIPQTTVWPEARGLARAVDVRRDADYERVVWSDGVSLRRLADQTTFFLPATCDPAAVARRFLAASDAYVATQFEVFRVDTECPEGACLQPVFGLAEYHAAASPFMPPELASCDSCASALPAECWGREQCRDPSFDDTVCAGCDPSGCPRFEIVDLVALSAMELGVVTTRGIVVVSVADGSARRRETLFDPTVSGGPRFVKGLAAPADLTLVHSTGFFRVLGPNLVPRFPDLGVAFDAEAATLVGTQDVLFAVDPDGVRIVRPGNLSGRTAIVDLGSAPGVQGLRGIGVVNTPDGVRVIYAAASQLYPRLFTRR